MIPNSLDATSFSERESTTNATDTGSVWKICLCVASLALAATLYPYSKTLSLGSALFVMAIFLLLKFGPVLTVVMCSVAVFSLPSALGGLAVSGVSATEIMAGLIVILSLGALIQVAAVDPIYYLLVAFYGIVLLWAAIMSFTYPIDFVFTGCVSLLLPVAASVVTVGALRRLRARREHDFHLGVVGVVGVVGACAAWNVYLSLEQSFKGLSADELIRVQTAGSTYLVGDAERSIGGFDSSQTLGLYLGFVATFFLVAWPTFSRALRFVFLSVGVASATALSLTLLRGPLLGCAAAVLTFMFVCAVQSRLGARRRLALTIVTLFVFGLCVSSYRGQGRWRTMRDRISTVFDLEYDRSFQDRKYSTLPTAIRLFRDNIWGRGPGSSGPVSEQYSSVAPLGGVVADNGYLNLGIQLGFPGLIIIVGLLSILMVRLGKASGSLVSVGASAVVLYLLVSMFFGSYWNLAGPMVVGGVLVGLGVSVSRSVSAGTSSKLSRREAFV